MQGCAGWRGNGSPEGDGGGGGAEVAPTGEGGEDKGVVDGMVVVAGVTSREPNTKMGSVGATSRRCTLTRPPPVAYTDTTTNLELGGSSTSFSSG